MTAKQLFIQIEDKMRESLALCDIVATAASSDSFELDSESVSRVIAIAINDLREILEYCNSSTTEDEAIENLNQLNG